MKIDTWRIYQCGEHRVARTDSPSALTNEVSLRRCYLAHPPGGQDFQDNVLGSNPLVNYSLPRELRIDTWHIYQCGDHHVAGTDSPSTLTNEVFVDGLLSCTSSLRTGLLRQCLGSNPFENYSLPRVLRIDTWHIYQCGDHHVAGTDSPSALTNEVFVDGLLSRTSSLRAGL